MFRTKHVALWLLMFWFCHLFDLQNGIYVTTSSSLGVWVPVFMMSNSKRICSFSGGYTVFRFIPPHLWSMAAYPTSLTATPYHMPLILPLKYKPAAKSGKSTTKNCLSTWKTANLSIFWQRRKSKYMAKPYLFETDLIANDTSVCMSLARQFKSNYF